MNDETHQEFKNKVCLITGGAGSIGLATALKVFNAGGKVALIDHSLEQLEKAKTEFNDLSRLLILQADVSDSQDTQNYISQIITKWGKIDVLFSNAGFSGTSAPITDYPEDVFDKVMAINVRGSFLACKYALPKINNGGNILITSSIMGVTARPGSIAYITSKHALIGLMRGISKEAAPQNVRVNVLAPGPVDNTFQFEIEERASKASGTNVTKMLNNWIALGRHATPEEIANMAYFLMSDKSSFSTGGVFMADGGMHV